MPDALLIDGRNSARSVSSLEMRCDKREIPDPNDGEQVLGYWIAVAGVAGEIPLLEKNGSLAQASSVDYRGLAALAVTDSRLLAIVGSGRDTDPAVWIATSRKMLEIETSGQRGLISKRPERIALKVGHGEVVLGLVEVCRLWRNISRKQNGQESSLLSALRM